MDELKKTAKYKARPVPKLELLARAAKWNYKKEMPPVKSHL
jgi:hypothetical protein